MIRAAIRTVPSDLGPVTVLIAVVAGAVVGCWCAMSWAAP